MATTTTNLSLTKPAVNSAVDEDLWGAQLNTDLDLLDSEAAVSTIDKDYADKEVSRAKVKDFSETTNDLGNISGAVAVDYTDGHYQYGTLTGNISSLTINNPPASGIGGFLTLEFTQDGTGSRTIDLTGGSYRSIDTITLSTAGGSIDKLRLETRNASTWDVALSANYTVIT